MTDAQALKEIYALGYRPIWMSLNRDGTYTPIFHPRQTSLQDELSRLRAVGPYHTATERATQ